MSKLLVIDDESAILNCCRLAFPESEVRTAETATAGLAQFERARPDVVLLDINLPDQSGLEAFRKIHDIDPRVPVILMTGNGTTESAIEAMALGAYEYLLKPLEFAHLRTLVSKAAEDSQLMRVRAVVEPETDSPDTDPLVGRCPAMQAVYKEIGRVATRDVTVLVLGESGTGKELVARAIYNYSRRRSAPFLAINCAAIPETLLESELFGHEKGAFTGADRRRIGKFEQCSGGTLFLDEVGDMTALTQTKILRVLQDQSFERVGGGETIRTDVRIIAATNRDLDAMVDSGRFRSDLFYRLNVFTIRLPALRERLEDLPLLVEHFRRRFCRELGKDVHAITPEALALMRGYTWPGNIRELQSVLKQAILHARGPVLTPESLPPALQNAAPLVAVFPQPPVDTEISNLDRFIRERLDAGSTDLHSEWLRVTERHLFERVLEQTRGNLSHAARILGIHRATLRTKLLALDMNPERFAAAAGE